MPFTLSCKIKHWHAHTHVSLCRHPCTCLSICAHAYPFVHMPFHSCSCLSIRAFPFVHMPLSFASMLAHLHASAIVCRRSIASMRLHTYSCTGRHAHVHLCWYTGFCMHHCLRLHFVARPHIFICDHGLVRIHVHLFQHAFTCFCMHAHNLRVFGFPHNRLNVYMIFALSLAVAVPLT